MQLALLVKQFNPVGFRHSRDSAATDSHDSVCPSMWFQTGAEQCAPCRPDPENPRAVVHKDKNLVFVYED